MEEHGQRLRAEKEFNRETIPVIICLYCICDIKSHSLWAGDHTVKEKICHCLVYNNH